MVGGRAREGVASFMRCVVLLCGPPGAGKTTAARQSGLPVFDRDDEGWLGEKHFVSAIEELKGIPDARAVVIRSAAGSHLRRKWARRIGATHTFLLWHEREVLASRVVRRGRQDSQRSLAAIHQWFDLFDHDDGCPIFRDWGAVFGDSIGRVSARFA